LQKNNCCDIILSTKGVGANLKVENVNSFVQGAQNTLQMFVGDAVKLGKVYLKNPPYVSKDIAVIVGIVGDLKGEAIYTMDENCGLYLASKIMMGFEVTGLDEMAISAVKEIGNMISGNAASALFKYGTTVDITPPTFCQGANSETFNFIKPDAKIICMPIYLEGERIFEVDLHLPS